MQNDLRKVETVVKSDEYVQDQFGNQFNYDHIVCTREVAIDDGSVESHGTCGGDSGGPIIAPDGSVFGATSFGLVACALGPSCYTSAVFFKDFVDGGIAAA